MEFAILAPVFLMMLSGMMAYAIYFGALHSVQQLAADAARTSIAGITEAERNTLVRNFLSRNAGDYVLIDSRKLTYSVGDKPTDPNQYLVTLRYDATVLPIWSLVPTALMPQSTITQSYSIRKGGL